MEKKKTPDKITEAADRLFYEQGYEQTSFAQIAEVVGISRGNFYHHFKTKDEILNAVIDRRIAQTNAMLDSWEIGGDTPLQRIESFVNILLRNQADITRYGCPVGTLSGELIKLDHPSRNRANEIFSLFRVWLREQFERLERKDADELAMHVLAFSQGVAMLASAICDEKFIAREVARIQCWLQETLT